MGVTQYLNSWLYYQYKYSYVQAISMRYAVKIWAIGGSFAMLNFPDPPLPNKEEHTFW